MKNQAKFLRLPLMMLIVTSSTMMKSKLDKDGTDFDYLISVIFFKLTVAVVNYLKLFLFKHIRSDIFSFIG